MKNIDIKSLIIGALLTSTIFLGVAATGKTDKWDDKQLWSVTAMTQQEIRLDIEDPTGWEPIATHGTSIVFRKRVK